MLGIFGHDVFSSTPTRTYAASGSVSLSSARRYWICSNMIESSAGTEEVMETMIGLDDPGESRIHARTQER